MDKKPIVVDLFSGCGGFGLGAELAGFNVSVAVDIEPKLQFAYKLNFPYSKTHLGDVSEMGSDAWEFLIGSNEIDGVIGGPPCQGFSRMGKNDKKDPRRSLIFHYFRTVNIISPKFFIMENVEGLLDPGNASDLYDALSTLKSTYKTLSPIIVDASKYGAPTKRKRVIVVGYDPSRMDEISAEELQPQQNIKTNVRQAIGDIPNIISATKGETDFGWMKYGPGSASKYAQKMRKPPSQGLGHQRASEMQKNGFVSGGFETIHTPRVESRFKNTAPGDVEPISRYPRLDWQGLCPTLRAGTGSDRGNFQAMRPIHPSKPRVITVREAARLQGFPDWFLFHPTKHHSFRMIGNSVSPVLSQSILGVFREKLF